MSLHLDMCRREDRVNKAERPRTAEKSGQDHCIVPTRTLGPIDHGFLQTGGSSCYQWISDNFDTIELEPEMSRISFFDD